MTTRTATGGSFLSRMFLGPTGWRNCLLFLWVAALVQAAHSMEHFVQTYQVFVLKIPGPMASGLLGEQFDFPWVHFFYNEGYFAGLLWAVVWLYQLRRHRGWETGAIVFAAGFQFYHAFEHAVQIQQALATSPILLRPPGVIGLFGNNIVLHLMFNVIAWTPLLAAAVSLTLSEIRARRIRERTGKPARRTPGKRPAAD